MSTCCRSAATTIYGCFLAPTTGLGRCMSVCRRLHQMLSTPQLLRMLAIEHGFRARTVSNEDDGDLGTV